MSEFSAIASVSIQKACPVADNSVAENCSGGYKKADDSAAVEQLIGISQDDSAAVEQLTEISQGDCKYADREP